MKENMQKYLVEFIGTFFLVLTIGCTALLGAKGVIPAIAIGAVLMVMVYAGGHISGGHFNPAVSLAAWLRGALNKENLVPYWAFQILGGLGAAFVVIMLNKGGADEVSSFSIPALIVAEFLFTFALAYVVLQTATTESTEGNSYYGLAIGSIVMVGAFAVGGTICAGAFNPSVAISLGALHMASWWSIIFTIGANLLGAIAAALVFRLTYSEY